MTCYNPKPAKLIPFEKIDEKTGEIYKSYRLKFLPHEEKNYTSEKTTLIPCGKCEGCKVDKANDWATRVAKEAKIWPKNCFLTLTYNNDNLKSKSLNKRDFQLFMKRLRKETGEKLRYFCCGEYGSKTLRPHYHLALFNYWPDDCVYYKSNKIGDTLFTSKKLEKIWDKGYVVIGQLTYQSAAYIARYVQKKAHNTDETFKNLGLEKEFILMSRKPGIGLQKIQEDIERKGIWVFTKEGAKLKKLPQRIRRKWAEEINREEYDTWRKAESQKWKNYTKELFKGTSKNYGHYTKQLVESLKEKLKLLKRSDV